MTKIDLSAVEYTSAFAGVGSMPDRSINIAFGGATLNGNIIPGDYRTGSGTTNVDRTYTIADVELMLSGLLPSPIIDNGALEFYFNGSNRVTDFFSAKWALYLYGEFTGGGVYRYTYVIFTTAFESSIAVPAFNINVKLIQSVPPFEPE